MAAHHVHSGQKTITRYSTSNTTARRGVWERPPHGKFGIVTGAPLPPEMADAYFHYTGLPELVSGGVGFLVTQGILQAPQAAAGVKIGVYPSFGRAMLAETVVGLAGFPLILIYIDPAHQMEDFGLDETAWYKRNIEGKWEMTREEMRQMGPTYDFSSFRG
jgi:hypothetical protein